MSKLDIVRAWKDEEFRASLGTRVETMVPENPAGDTGISDEDLAMAAGGTTMTYVVICNSAISFCLQSQKIIDCIIPQTLTH